MHRSWLLVFFLIGFQAVSQEPLEIPPMEFSSIDERITLITAYEQMGDEIYPANYLVIEGDSVSILLDTPWNDRQTAELMAWADTALPKPIALALITHAHNDRMGGIATLHANGIATFIHPYAQAHNIDAGEFEPAEFLLVDEQTFDPGGIQVQAVYPGDGHAPGNMIVRVGRNGIYGGCFIKSAKSQTLGYTGDANVEKWYNAAIGVEHLFLLSEWVIPGHGDTSEGAYDNTITLLEKAIRELDKVE